MDNFNVIEFENIINNIIDRTVAAENCMHKLSSVMTELINCIGNQESKELYEGWDSVLSTTIEICNKFSSRKIEFINEFKSYRDSTIKLNTQISSELNTTIEKMNSISQLIDQL